MDRRTSPRWLSLQTSASAISTPSITPTGRWICTAKTYSALMSWPQLQGPQEPRRAETATAHAESHDLRSNHEIADFLLKGPDMVQEALGSLTVGLADSSTTQVVSPRSSTERGFAEVLADGIHLDRVSI